MSSSEPIQPYHVSAIIPALRGRRTVSEPQGGLPAGSSLFRVIGDHDAHSRVLIAKLTDKSRLDAFLGIQGRLNRLLACARTEPAVSAVRSLAASDGRHVYVSLPVSQGTPVGERLGKLSPEQRCELVTDLSLALYWLHDEPVRADLKSEAPSELTSENVLWQIAERHQRLRHEINRLLKMQANARSFFGSGRRTPVFKTAAAHMLDESDKLHFPLPPPIRCADPWLDLIRHIRLFDGETLPLRELLINLYFDLSPPAAFFHTYFLAELEARCLAWMDAKQRSHDTSLQAEAVRRLSGQYEGISPVPVWFSAAAAV